MRTHRSLSRIGESKIRKISCEYSSRECGCFAVRCSDGSHEAHGAGGWKKGEESRNFSDALPPFLPPVGDGSRNLRVAVELANVKCTDEAGGRVVAV